MSTEYAFQIQNVEISGKGDALILINSVTSMSIKDDSLIGDQISHLQMTEAKDIHERIRLKKSTSPNDQNIIPLAQVSKITIQIFELSINKQIES